MQSGWTGTSADDLLHSCRQIADAAHAHFRLAQALYALSNFDGGAAPCANDTSEKRVERCAVGAIFDGDVVMRLVKDGINKFRRNIAVQLQTCSSSLYCFTVLMRASTWEDCGSASSCRN